jgi:hypothetical protein
MRVGELFWSDGIQHVRYRDGTPSAKFVVLVAAPRIDEAYKRIGKVIVEFELINDYAHITHIRTPHPEFGKKYEYNAYDLLKFGIWLQRSGWQEHSSKEYWYKLEHQSQWPPRQENMCEVHELIEKWRQSL